MPDPVAAENLLAVGVGGAAALLGGGATALSENMTRKQVFGTLVSSLGLGCFVAPAVGHYCGLHWIASGCIGFALGIGCIPLVAGIRKVASKFAASPGAFIPQIRDAMKDESPAPKPEGIK